MYKYFEQLLQGRGLTTYRVSKDTGIAQSVFSAWKRGVSNPKPDKLQIIADYFNVSVDFLINGDDGEEGKYYLNDETAQAAQEIFENKELKVLFDAARDASPEDLKTTYEMLMALKRKEQGEDDA